MVQAGPRVGREDARVALPGVEPADRTRASRGVRRDTERPATDRPGWEPERALPTRWGGIACVGGRAWHRRRESGRGSRNADHVLLVELAGHCDERPLRRLRRAVSHKAMIEAQNLVKRYG